MGKRGKTITPLEDRFWPKVDKSDLKGCWVWLGAKRSTGYGVINLGGRGVGLAQAHRVAWNLLVGPIPEGMMLDHLCHNPVCVNPDHMRVCSNTENSRNSNLGVNNTSGFKGASWNKRMKYWEAKIMVDRKTIHLGNFSTPNSAHIAYRNAARTLHGEYANFGAP